MPVEHKLETLELACAAMWEIVREKLGVTEDELKAKMHEIHARDGEINGRIAAHATEVCPHCHHKLLTRGGKVCVWCGEALPVVPFGVAPVTE